MCLASAGLVKGQTAGKENSSHHRRILWLQDTLRRWGVERQVTGCLVGRRGGVLVGLVKRQAPRRQVRTSGEVVSHFNSLSNVFPQEV